MRYDRKENILFVTPKEKRSIKRVKAMLVGVCATHICTDCPFKIGDVCLKNQFERRFTRRALEEKE